MGIPCVDLIWEALQQNHSAWQCQGYSVKLRFYKGWKGGGNRTKVNVRSPPTYAACSAKAVAQHEAAKRAGG